MDRCSRGPAKPTRSEHSGSVTRKNPDRAEAHQYLVVADIILCHPTCGKSSLESGTRALTI